MIPLKLIDIIFCFIKKDIQKNGGPDSEQELKELDALRQEFSDAISRGWPWVGKLTEEET